MAHFVAPECPGKPEGEGARMDVVAHVCPETGVARFRAGHVPPERVVYRKREPQVCRREVVAQVTPRELQSRVACHAVVPRKKVCEPDVEDECLLPVQHPRGVQLDFSAPAAGVGVFEIAYL